MNSYSVSQLQSGSFFTNEVILDKTFVLLSSSNPVTKELIEALNDWDFKVVYSDGYIADRLNADVFSTSQFQAQSEQIIKEAENEKSIFSTEKLTKDVPQTEAERLLSVQQVYNEYLDYIGKIFTVYATKKQLNMAELSETSRSLVNFIKDNRKYVLRIQPSIHDNTAKRNFLISHTMRATVISIVIGLQMNFPMDTLTELGVACFLHEIGMIRLPPQLYLSERKLTQSEKNQIATHPILSYNILKDAGFPISVCLGVLEHHEKYNGKGYPRKISAESISPFARIISVACTYEAITAPRQYKDEQSSFSAMVEILKNQEMQYDSKVITALLLSVSFYPIGAYVYLSNNKVAQVIEANPRNPKCPIVQLLTETESNGDLKTLSTSENGIWISRVLSKKESDDVLASLKNLQNQKDS
ncbi:MAG: HD-GYP domain-containing protein [Treponemataceae bacterium]